MKPREGDWQALHRQLQSIARARGELDALEAQCLREAVRLKLWAELGYVHMSEYLDHEMGYDPRKAAERLRVALALEELPQIEASLAEGMLRYSAVRELSRVATGETEEEWLAAARGKTLRELEPLVSGRMRGDRPGDPPRNELRKRVVRLELSPEAFALLRQTQGLLADEHGARLEDSAFVEILCRRALEGGVSSGSPAHQIAFTVCESCKRGWQDGAGREIEVGPEVVERAFCDAELIGSLDAPAPERVTATVTPRIRRQVFARDHHRCTVPGCRSARNLDLHHIEYQCDGGGHQLWNLTAVCSGHHERLHAGTLTIRGKAPHALEFVWRAPPSGAPEQGSASGERWRNAGIQRIARRSGEPGAPVGSVGCDEPIAPTHIPAHATVAEQGFVSEAEPVSRIDLHEASPTCIPGPAHETAAEPGFVERHLCASRGAARRFPPPQAAPTAASPRRPARDEGAAHDAHPGADRVGEIDRDARDALTAAGYKQQQARAAVELARSQVGTAASLEQLLRAALRCCARPGSG